MVQQNFSKRRLSGSLHVVPYSATTIANKSNDVWRTGAACLDDCLAQYGLSTKHVHEITSHHTSHLGSATVFALALLALRRSQKPIIWCAFEGNLREHGRPYLHGLLKFGLSPHQFIFAAAPKPDLFHGAIEDALRTKGVAAVVGEGPPPGFTGSRRLALLSKQHDVPCLLVHSEKERHEGSAAATRFIVRSVAGPNNPADPLGPGLTTWQVELARNRFGRASPSLQSNTAHPWRLAWDETTYSFAPASLFSDRTSRDRTKPSHFGKQPALVG